MNGKTLTDKALKIYGAINQSGGIDSNKNADYYAVAPMFIETIQEELAILEGLSITDNTISNLDEQLEISDKSCNMCGIFYLAFMFAQLDGDSARATNYYEIYDKNRQFINRKLSVIEDAFFQ